MNTFFPHMAVDQKPWSPSKAERATSWVAGLAVMPAVALQMIGAIPLHAVRDSRLGAIGGTVDSIFELFHGFVSTAAPKVASWAGALPPAAVHAVYFFALTLFVGSFAASVLLGMRREQRNVARRMGDTRSW